MIYSALQERMETRTLDNGLRVCYLPKPEFSRTFATLVTNYGSIDLSFTLDGIYYNTPAGVAHFLEHQMFENADGNALQKFLKNGAISNASTSQTTTAYYFLCPERFEENLEILLQSVFTPYFTDENIEKERGIIEQEIDMMYDTPGWHAYTGLFEGLFHEHPVQIPIAGTEESIEEITPDILYTCHNAFYRPENMVLVVCGEADFDSICHIATQYSPRGTANGIRQDCVQRDYGKRSETTAASIVTTELPVARPNFMFGYRDAPLAADESYLRRKILGELALRILCGETSPLYAELYESHLVNYNFDTDYQLFPEGAAAVLGGGSRDPYAVQTVIQRETTRLAREGVDDALFSRMKKALYGLYLRVLDQPDEYARQQAESMFNGENYLDFAALFDTIGPDDVQTMYARWVQPDRSTLSCVESEIRPVQPVRDEQEERKEE